METLIIHAHGTCSTEIHVDHENGIIQHVTFIGGCRGNTKGVAALLVGMKLEEAARRLEGIMCRNGTSCPNELAKGIKEYLARQ